MRSVRDDVWKENLPALESLALVKRVLSLWSDARLESIAWDRTNNWKKLEADRLVALDELLTQGIARIFAMPSPSPGVFKVLRLEIAKTPPQGWKAVERYRAARLDAHRWRLGWSDVHRWVERLEIRSTPTPTRAQEHLNDALSRGVALWAQDELRTRSELHWTSEDR